MSKVPTVTFMRVTSQDDAQQGRGVYVFHHEADEVLRGIADGPAHMTGEHAHFR